LIKLFDVFVMLPIIDRFSFSVIKAGSSISLQIRWFEIAAVSRQAFDDSADVRRHAEELKRGEMCKPAGVGCPEVTSGTRTSCGHLPWAGVK
jgi:hypothetical protein